MNGEPVVGASPEHARTLMELGRRADAAALLRRLLAEDPGNSTLRAWLALCLMDDEPELALDHAERAVASDPFDPAALDALALTRWACEDHRGAYQAASSLVELVPHDAGAHALLARCAASAGRRRVAMRAAGAALRSDPGLAAAWTARSHALLSCWRPKAAEADVRRALAIDPDDPAALEMLSLVLTARGRVTEAIDAAEGLASVDPADPAALRVARHAAVSSAGFGLVLGLFAGRLVANRYDGSALGVPSEVLGIVAMVIVGLSSAAVARRIASRGHPRDAAVRLRRWTRLSYLGVALTLVGLIAVAYLRAPDPVPGPTSAMQAVTEQLPSAIEIERLASGTSEYAWELVSFTGAADAAMPCAALVLFTEQGWQVATTTCAAAGSEATTATRLRAGEQSFVVGVATTDVIEVVATGDALPGHIAMPSRGPTHPRFLLIEATAGGNVVEVRRDGSEALVEVGR